MKGGFEVEGWIFVDKLLQFYNSIQQNVFFFIGFESFLAHVVLDDGKGVLYFLKPLPPFFFYSIQLLNFYSFLCFFVFLVVFLEVFSESEEDIDHILLVGLFSPQFKTFIFLLFLCCLPVVPPGERFYLVVDLFLHVKGHRGIH